MTLFSWCSFSGVRRPPGGSGGILTTSARAPGPVACGTGLFLLFAALATGGLEAAETSNAAASKDKSAYTLFNPTPRDQMRELAADRPDKIESPYTVDAGHFQVETDLVGWKLNRSGGVETRTWDTFTPNFKIGLLNNLDLEFIFNGLLHQRMDDRALGERTTRSGVGNLGTRVKINFFGNDGGSVAMAAIPFLFYPTSTRDLGSYKLEGGILFPVLIKLPAGWGLNLQTEFNCFQNHAGPGHHAEFSYICSVEHEIVGKLAGYVEFFSAISTEPGQDWVGTVDCGLTYQLTDDIQLDCGVNIGVTRAADRVNPFTGLTVRF